MQGTAGVTPPGWRNLALSKWRLTKGDEQLDFTYASSNPPHHISDEALSELTYCIYKVSTSTGCKAVVGPICMLVLSQVPGWMTPLHHCVAQARRLPQDVLESHVRTTFAANEYPMSMQRLYEWSPDECIPEFYTDACTLESLHADMPDLAVPAWAQDAEDFIRRHRSACHACNQCPNKLTGLHLGAAAYLKRQMVLHGLPCHASTLPTIAKPQRILSCLLSLEHPV